MVFVSDTIVMTQVLDPCQFKLHISSRCIEVTTETNMSNPSEAFVVQLAAIVNIYLDYLAFLPDVITRGDLCGCFRSL